MADAGAMQTGCWLELPSPEIGEIAAGAGFDFAIEGLAAMGFTHAAADVSDVGVLVGGFGANLAAARREGPDGQG